MGLGIDGELHRHVELGGLIDKQVADAIVMFDHRHARERDDGFDETFAAARDDQVEPLVHLREGGDAFAIGERDELDRVFGRACRGECGGDRAVRMNRFAATAKNRGVTGLETKRGRVGGDIRAAFVNDADGADRHAHLLDANAVRALPGIHHLSDWIR